MNLQRSLLFGTASVVPALVILLLAIIVWISFTYYAPGQQAVSLFHNYAEAFADPFTSTAIFNTVKFTIATIVIAFFFGLPIAWITERTNIRGKYVIYSVMLLGLVIPTFFLAMGWILFAHPRIGLLNKLAQQLFGPEALFFNVSTVWGMGFVEGLSLAPHVFVMTSSALRLMNPSLEEAGTVHGLRRGQIMRHVSIPLLMPALAAAAIYIAVIAASAFDVPAVIGLANRVYTFSTMIYVMALSPDRAPQYGIPAAVGVAMCLVGLVMTLWYIRFLKSAKKFQVVSGKAYRPALEDLGRRKWLAWLFIGFFLFLSLGIPFLLVAWASFMPFLVVPSLETLHLLSFGQYQSLNWDLMLRGAKNTALLFVIVPTLTIAFSIPLAWVITRSRSKLRYVYELLVFLPHAVPKVVFGVAALVLSLFILDKILPIYGTVWLIVIIYVVERITFSSRVINSSMLQIHEELEEAAYVSGMSTFETLRSIMLPILWPTIISIWLWMALLCYKELTVAAILFTPESITMPVVIWSMWAGGGMGRAAAATLVMLGFFIPLLSVYWFIGRRRGGAHL